MKNKTSRLSKFSLIAAAALAVCAAAPQAKAYDYANWNTEANSATINGNFGGFNSGDYLTPTLNRIRAGVFQVPNATLSFAGNDDWNLFSGWSDSFFAFDLMAIQGGSQVHTYQAVSGVDDNGNYTLAGDNLLPIQSTQLRFWRRLDNDSNDGTVYLYYNFGYNERAFQTARTGLGINGNETGSFAPAFSADNSAALNSVFAPSVSYDGEGMASFDSTPIGSVVRNGNITLGIVGGVAQLDGLYAKDAGWLDIRGDLTLYDQGTLYIRDGEVTSNVYRNDNLGIGIGGEGEGNLYDTRGTLEFDSGILSVRQRFAQDMAVNEGQTLGFRDGAANSTTFDITGGGYWQLSDLTNGLIGPFDSSTINVPNYYNPYVLNSIGSGPLLGGSGNGLLYALIGRGAVRSITGDNVQNGNISIGLVSPTRAGYFLPGGFDASFGRINADRYVDSLGATVSSKLTINGNVNGVNSLGSNGGALAIFGGDGDIIVNGQVGAGVFAVYKDGLGELTLTAANVHADTVVTNGVVRATHGQALGTGEVTVTAFGLLELWSASITGGAPESFARLSGGSVILDPAHSSRGNLTFANDFRLGGLGNASFFTGEGEGHFAAGTGISLETASLVNQSGNNTITGDIFVGSDVLAFGGEGEGLFVPEASILVKNGTNLTVTGDVVASYGSSTGTRTHLFVATVNQGAITANLHLDGDMLGIDEVTKNGAGFARIARVDGALDTVNVNGGTLRINGSVNSSAIAPYGSFDKNGVGKLEVYGTHHYSSFDTLGGTTDIYGSVTLQGPASNGDIDIQNGATVNVESGGSLIHVSSDGLGGSFSNGFDINGASTLNVKSGGTVNLNGAEIDLDDTSSIIVGGTLSTTDAIYSNAASTVTVLAGGVINANIETQDDFTSPRHGSTITVNGALNGNVDLNQSSDLIVNSGGVLTGNIQADDVTTIEIKSLGQITGNITAFDEAVIRLRSGGTIVGNVETYEESEFIIEANSTHTGDYNAYGDAVVVVNGTIGEGSLFAQNFRLGGFARLKGNGRINGSLEQTGGVVAPGNSPGILNVGGDYSISGGSLQIELEGLAGPGVVGGHDQLRVGGTITLSGTSQLNFIFPVGNPYQARRGDVFQVLAGSSGEAKASIGRFDTVQWQDSAFRVLFDHSTGRGYGTGLNFGTFGRSFQTFTQYADSANRHEIARALWMESIDYDNSDLGLTGEGGSAIVDENYANTATGVNGVPDALAKRGYKAYILTAGTVGAQTATDLGQAAVSVLTAADVGSVLDSLSPEAYAGITDLGIRVARGFAFLPFNQRRLGAVNDWDFSVGYNNDEVETNSTASYNNYKVRSNQVNVTAARDLSDNARFSLGVGSDEGRVLARNFSADVDTLGLGLGLILKPDSDAYRLDLGVAFTTSDWDSTRQGVSAGNDMSTAAFAARLTMNTAAKGNLSYKPFVALSYTDANIDSFVEGDVPGSVQLGVSAFERKSLLGELGMDFEYKLGAQTTLTGIVSWQHEFEDSGATDLRAEFVEDGVDDTAFTVRSAGFGQDFFRAGLGLRHDLNPTSAVSLSVNAIFGSDIGSGHQIRADYSVRF